MPEALRIATLNCENLFSRPKIFLSDESNDLIKFVQELNEELEKTTFDHERIKELKKELKGFAVVQDIKKHTSAKGAGEWLGWVELVRERVDDMAIQNTARVLAAINADLMCLCEIESRAVFTRFHDHVLKPGFLNPAGIPGYENLLVIDGNDERGIDVALMSRYPLHRVETHMFERTIYEGNEVPLFSRDCLEVEVAVTSDIRVTLLINHFKSMGYSPRSDPQSNNRRREQAERVAEIASEFDLKRQYLVVAGDLNSEPDSASLAPLIDKNDLYNVNLELPEDGRWTYGTGSGQLDYLLISDALKAKLKSVHIERRGAYAARKWKPFPEVTSEETAASDHSAVVADFDL
jgi:endonuclease/exonuclease/phosphatase family metal-dependent hydrolase